MPRNSQVTFCSNLYLLIFVDPIVNSHCSRHLLIRPSLIPKQSWYVALWLSFCRVGNLHTGNLHHLLLITKQENRTRAWTWRSDFNLTLLTIILDLTYVLYFLSVKMIFDENIHEKPWDTVSSIKILLLLIFVVLY